MRYSSSYIRCFSTTTSIPQVEKILFSTVNQQTHLAEFPQIDSGLAVPVFKQEMHIDAINQNAVIFGRQSSFAAGTSGTRANISGISGNKPGQQMIVKCFNRQGEGHMAKRQYPKPKRKMEAYMDPKLQEAKAVLMANLSNYKSDVLSEVLHSEITYNDMLNQSVQEMQYSEQTQIVNHPENEDTNSPAQQDAVVHSGVFEQLSQQILVKQAFRLQTSLPNTDQSTSSPVKIKAPREFPKTLKDIFNAFDKDLLNEVTEVQTVFNQMEADVEQLSIVNDTTITPGMYKLDLVTLAPKDKNNRETHIYYLKHTMEQAAILREIS
ncbi:hypothetical protein Tco_0941902 [Tanacetum coccineum]|uniref:Uncharacterized protein n=1 Tax=Tanacetum coccineum TaxID=301880 RepID=A0ABQ5DSY9_9ASTR